MKNLLFYLSLVALTVYVEIMYEEFEGTAFVAFELLLFVCLFFLAWYLKRRVSMKLEIAIPVIAKGGIIEMKLQAVNRGFLPASRVDICIEAANPLNESISREWIRFSIPARGERELNFQASADYCGRIHFQVERAQISDYLGLFRFRIRCRDRISVNVLPCFYEMQAEISAKTRNFTTDGEMYDPHRSGDDVSEIFRLREFRDGDSLQRVHWKLSAKSEDLLVREFGRPVSVSILVLLDFGLEKSRKPNLKAWDAMLELASAISATLWQAGVFHCIAWLEPEVGIRRQAVCSQEQVYEAVDRYLGTLPQKECSDLWELYHQKYPLERFSSVLMLDTNLRIQVDEQEKAVFMPEGLMEQMGRFILEV